MWGEWKGYVQGESAERMRGRDGWMENEGFTCFKRLNSRAALCPETLDIRWRCQSIQRDWLKD